MHSTDFLWSQGVSGSLTLAPKNLTSRKTSRLLTIFFYGLCWTSALFSGFSSPKKTVRPRLLQKGRSFVFLFDDDWRLILQFIELLWQGQVVLTSENWSHGIDGRKIKVLTRGQGGEDSGGNIMWPGRFFINRKLPFCLKRSSIFSEVAFKKNTQDSKELGD